MQPYPHHYTVHALGPAAGALQLDTQGAPSLACAPPREFDGPGDQWSPEALLVAAAASCFILSFRAVARASHLPWVRLECSVEGTLERVEGVTRFTRMLTRARLTAPASASVELCEKLLHKAEAVCLIANSLNATRELRTEIVLQAEALEPA